MKHRIFRSRHFTGLLAMGLALTAQFAVAKDEAKSDTSKARIFVIDKSHSNVAFVARHFVSKVNGEFKDYEGEFVFDLNHPESSHVTAIVKAASISTNDNKRDEHLMSDDFFGVKKYPTLKFESKELKSKGDKKYEMKGDLTLKGVTKSVEFDVEFLGEADDPWGNHRAGFTATTKINRKDFGMNWNKTLDNGGMILGEEIVINLNVEAIEKKPLSDKQDVKDKKETTRQGESKK